MGAAGLLALLLLLLLGVPGRPDPPPALCDPRVVERFIMEAREAETGLAGCGSPCDLPEPVSVPDPGVNFNLWLRMDAAQRAQEVGGGGAALVAAVRRARDLLPNPHLRPLLDRALGAARGLQRLLQAVPGAAPPPTAALPPPRLRVRSLIRLLGAQSNFLRGKLRLFLGEACPR
ncbi:erythropoietin [Patagioenas fasciata]|uniref:erythropoietin n=1 Tax=Patagioenas fasciata TaxID=372321 RepID=UPI003A99AC00